MLGTGEEEPGISRHEAEVPEISAYSALLTPRDVHVIFEVGYSQNSGEVWPTIAYDAGTYVPHEVRYWFVPVTIGIRTNLVPERYQGPLGLYFGIGMVTMFTGSEEPSREGTAPTLGGMLEFRPQLKVARGIAVWVRERLTVVADAEYGFQITAAPRCSWVSVSELPEGRNSAWTEFYQRHGPREHLRDPGNRLCPYVA